MNVCIIGTGYVGLTTGTCLAFLGHQVTCIDSDEKKIAMLQAGQTPIYEPFLTELMAEAKNNLRFSTCYGEAIPGARVIFIAVGTPPLPNGSPDLRYLSAAARGIGEHFDGDFTVVVNKSTVPIGSGNWVGSLVRESYEQAHGRRAGRRFAVASNPERLWPTVSMPIAWWSAPTTLAHSKRSIRSTGRFSIRLSELPHSCLAPKRRVPYRWFPLTWHRPN
jgi:UDPglucose 6-dehydrogenase